MIDDASQRVRRLDRRFLRWWLKVKLAGVWRASGMARDRQNWCNYGNFETQSAANHEGAREQRPILIGPDRGADNGNYAAYDLNDA